MKPVLINTSFQGGAARACIRLHHALLSKQIESSVLIKTPKNNPLTNGIFKVEQEENKILRAVKKRLKLYSNTAILKKLKFFRKLMSWDKLAFLLILLT
jgi:hypothetical protein